jgi:hypothetical protein
MFILFYISIFYGPIPVNSGWHTSCDTHITFSENKVYIYDIKQILMKFSFGIFRAGRYNFHHHSDDPVCN